MALTNAHRTDGLLIDLKAQKWSACHPLQRRFVINEGITTV